MFLYTLKSFKNLQPEGCILCKTLKKNCPWSLQSCKFFKNLQPEGFNLRPGLHQTSHCKSGSANWVSTQPNMVKIGSLYTVKMNHFFPVNFPSRKGLKTLSKCLTLRMVNIFPGIVKPYIKGKNSFYARYWKTKPAIKGKNTV